jgi:hypothetical protein
MASHTLRVTRFCHVEFLHGTAHSFRFIHLQGLAHQYINAYLYTRTFTSRCIYIHIYIHMHIYIYKSIFRCGYVIPCMIKLFAFESPGKHQKPIYFNVRARMDYQEVFSKTPYSNGKTDWLLTFCGNSNAKSLMLYTIIYDTNITQTKRHACMHAHIHTDVCTDVSCIHMPKYVMFIRTDEQAYTDAQVCMYIFSDPHAYTRTHVARLRHASRLACLHEALITARCELSSAATCYNNEAAVARSLHRTYIGRSRALKWALAARNTAYMRWCVQAAFGMWAFEACRVVRERLRQDLASACRDAAHQEAVMEILSARNAAELFDYDAIWVWLGVPLPSPGNAAVAPEEVRFELEATVIARVCQDLGSSVCVWWLSACQDRWTLLLLHIDGRDATQHMIAALDGHVLHVAGMLPVKTRARAVGGISCDVYNLLRQRDAKSPQTSPSKMWQGDGSPGTGMGNDSARRQTGSLSPSGASPATPASRARSQSAGLDAISPYQHRREGLAEAHQNDVAPNAGNKSGARGGGSPGRLLSMSSAASPVTKWRSPQMHVHTSFDGQHGVGMSRALMQHHASHASSKRTGSYFGSDAITRSSEHRGANGRNSVIMELVSPKLGRRRRSGDASNATEARAATSIGSVATLYKSNAVTPRSSNHQQAQLNGRAEDTQADRAHQLEWQVSPGLETEEHVKLPWSVHPAGPTVWALHTTDLDRPPDLSLGRTDFPLGQREYSPGLAEYSSGRTEFSPGSHVDASIIRVVSLTHDVLRPHRSAEDSCQDMSKALLQTSLDRPETRKQRLHASSSSPSLSVHSIPRRGLRARREVLHSEGSELLVKSLDGQLLPREDVRSQASSKRHEWMHDP